MTKLRDQLLIKKIPTKSTSTAIKKKMSTLQRQYRSYLLTNSGVLIYPSKFGSGQNLSGEVQDHKGKHIVCRHFSGYLAFKSERGIKHYHDAYGPAETIAKIDYLRKKE